MRQTHLVGQPWDVALAGMVRDETLVGGDDVGIPNRIRSKVKEWQSHDRMLYVMTTISYSPEPTALAVFDAE